MAKIVQRDLETVILDGETRTFGTLCTFFAANDANAMQIDRTLQKLRRRGQVSFKRQGRLILWCATPLSPTGVS